MLIIIHREYLSLRPVAVAVEPVASAVLLARAIALHESGDARSAIRAGLARRDARSGGAYALQARVRVLATGAAPHQNVPEYVSETVSWSQSVWPEVGATEVPLTSIRVGEPKGFFQIVKKSPTV